MKALILILLVGMANGAGLGLSPNQLHFNNSKEVQHVILHNPNPWPVRVNSSLANTWIEPYGKKIIRISGITDDAKFEITARYEDLIMQTPIYIESEKYPERPVPWKMMVAGGIFICGAGIACGRLLLRNS
ncbi:MAG: hypothetical protein ACLFP2_02950 [Candidatus Woesearchaeota archaeon]